MGGVGKAGREGDSDPERESQDWRFGLWGDCEILLEPQPGTSQTRGLGWEQLEDSEDLKFRRAAGPETPLRSTQTAPDRSSGASWLTPTQASPPNSPRKDPRLAPARTHTYRDRGTLTNSLTGPHRLGNSGPTSSLMHHPQQPLATAHPVPGPPDALPPLSGEPPPLTARPPAPAFPGGRGSGDSPSQTPKCLR